MSTEIKTLLTIESSGTVAGAAVFQGERVVVSKIIDNGLTHSQKLMICVDEVVKEAELEKSDIEAVAVSNGPGSFTGLRIGVTTAKAIGQALKIPVIPVNTLDAMAISGMWFSGLICPMINARREQVFTSIYKQQNNGNIKRVSEYLALPITEIAKELLSYQLPIVCCGDGAVIYKEKLNELLKGQAIFVNEAQTYPSPVNVGIKAIDLIKEEKWCKAEAVVPFYLRKSQAEQKKEQEKSK